MDRLSSERRSWNMSKIKNRNTSPELKVRSLLHRKGYRFRLHRKDLPGTPDIVLPKYHTVIFVHGCFWHRHMHCKEGAYFPRDPIKGVEFWQDKFEKTMKRDQINIEALKMCGWRVVVIWECQISNENKIEDVIRDIF